jgi:hypothetical protein
VPTVTALKKWQHKTLVSAVGDDVGDQKDLEIKIKNQRKTFGHVVAGSSNGTTGAMDGVDRWPDATGIPNAVSIPWLVLTQPGSGAQDLIFYGNFGSSNWGFAHSPSGAFTGGSASTVPTATDSAVHSDGTFALYSNTWHGRDDGGHAAPLICLLSVSTDLTCCRQFFFFNNHNYGNRMFDIVDDPSAGWAHPNYAVIDKEGVSKNQNCNCGMLYQFVYGPYTGKGYFNSWGPHGAMNLFATVEAGVSSRLDTGAGAVTWHSAANKITGTYRNPPRLGLVEPIANADGGWHGKVFDWWWVGNNPGPGGEASYQWGISATSPLDGSKQFAIIGDLMVPYTDVVRTA